MSDAPKRPLVGFFTILCCVAIIMAYFWGNITPPYTVAFDPNPEQCLPDLHLALLKHRRPTAVAHGDYVFWHPTNRLAYVGQEFVLKEVAGVEGDHLQILGGVVRINGLEVVSGLPLRKWYRKDIPQFDRDEIIPRGKLFVIGTHPNSDDSRYWGYLDLAEVTGTGTKLL